MEAVTWNARNEQHSARKRVSKSSVSPNFMHWAPPFEKPLQIFSKQPPSLLPAKRIKKIEKNLFFPSPFC
jgi:hypothetical protein